MNSDICIKISILKFLLFACVNVWWCVYFNLKNFHIQIKDFHIFKQSDICIHKSMVTWIFRFTKSPYDKIGPLFASKMNHDMNIQFYLTYVVPVWIKKICIFKWMCLLLFMSD